MFGRSRLGVLVILAVVLAVACGEDDGPATVAPIAATGTVSAPDRPIIVDPLPKGWSVESAEIGDYRGAEQSLYLPPGSTPEHGPALAVGQYGEESGSTLCGTSTSGDLINVSVSPGADLEGYVLGRDLSKVTVETAGRAARFADFTTSELAPDGLPAGFRKVAVAPVIPNSPYLGETMRLTNADGSDYILISAYTGDAAAKLLTRFWNATVVAEPCGNIKARVVRDIDGTNVLVEGDAPKAIVDEIAHRLKPTDQPGFDAFRNQIGEVPAAALLGCLKVDPGPDVVIEGTEGNVRWLIGIAPIGDRGFTCTNYIVDGEGLGESASTLGGALQGPGSHDIEALAGSSLIRASEVLTTVAGTVPSSATRVVITAGPDVTTDAKLQPAGDPALQYFGGFFRTRGNLPPGATVVAYDANGNEVGRYVPPGVP